MSAFDSMANALSGWGLWIALVGAHAWEPTSVVQSGCFYLKALIKKVKSFAG